MKNLNKKKIATVLAILGVAFLSGCGSGNNGSTAPVVGTSNGLYGLGVGAGGCVPITQPISFQINGAYFDSSNLVGGQIPQTGTSIGQFAGIGAGGGIVGSYVGSNWTYGTVSMQINSMGAYQSGIYNSQYPSYQVPYSGYPQYAPNNPYGSYGSVNPNQAVVQGSIQISPSMINTIMSQMSPYGYGGYPSPYNTGMQQGLFAYPGVSPQPLGAGGGYPCVSQVAMNIGHSGFQLYGGQVFLYMNGTANGYVLQF